jgi:signal transduction histidine kinase
MAEVQLEKELESILGQQPGLKILNSMGFSIAILDSDLRIVWANRGYHEMHGVLDEDIRGQYCYEVSFGNREPCPENLCPARRTIRTQENAKSMGTLHKSGDIIRYLDVYCFPLKSPDNEVTHVIEVVQDNTKLHELIQFAEDATHIVSHELKSPLSSIASLARAVLEPGVATEQKERFLYRIVSRAESASGMIEEYLTLSAISSGNLKMTLKRVNFYNEVVEAAIDHQKESMAEKGMSARIDIPWELEVVCDPAYIQIAYNNLISNATKYGAIGTEVHLDYVGPVDGYHYFSVSNIGEWIKEGDRERIFEKYITLGRRGTGIGLNTTREIIRKHGGEISVEPCYFATGKYITEKSIAKQTMIAEEYLDELPKGNSFVFTIPARYTVPSDDTE